MLATPNSTKFQGLLGRGYSRFLRPRRFLAWIFFSTAAIGNVPGQDASNSVFHQRAEKAFQAATARLASNTNDPATLEDVARTAYDFADLQTKDARKREIAEQGIAAAEHLIALNPQSAAAHYYLGMDHGELAETETVGALKLVREMEAEFTFVVRTNAAFDHAGPDRNLGLLYRDAPGWPASIGSRDKARQHLEQALKLAPDYPENLLNVIEAEIKWSEPAKARSNLDALDKLWPKARKQFAREQWEPAWADWTQRREAARKKTASAPPAESPQKQ